MKRKLVGVAAAMVLAVVSLPASAVIINFGPGVTTTQGGAVNFNLVVPTSILGNATLEITVQGDLNGSNEGFDTLVDGNSIGIAGVTGAIPDPFPGLPDSYGGTIHQLGNIYTVSTILTEAFLAPLIADGVLTLSFDSNDNVHAITNPDAGSPFDSFSNFALGVQGTLTFEAGSVPEPTTLTLAALALAGAGYRRRNRTC